LARDGGLATGPGGRIIGRLAAGADGQCEDANQDGADGEAHAGEGEPVGACDAVT
jgi:hypothetical protein